MGTDSLYYIMDYSGNYYRTNQADQLVSVVSQQDAMVFTFAAGKQPDMCWEKGSILLHDTDRR